MTDKEKPTWKLTEWNGYFSFMRKVQLPPMTQEEINKAIVFLTDNNYPIPVDCPRNQKCPHFKPVCLLYPVCNVAKGMCQASGKAVKCRTCDNLIDFDSPLKPFRDELSIKEYGISGMCQRCQDKTFAPKHPDDDYCNTCKGKNTDACKECPI